MYINIESIPRYDRWIMQQNLIIWFESNKNYNEDELINIINILILK